MDEGGVVAAIEYLIHEPSMAGPQITFEHNAKFPRLAPVLEAAIFRIAQETLNNAKQHSGSPKIEVILKRNKNRIQLDVRDWGKGFASTRISKESHGLHGIRERGRLLGGLVVIDSEPEKERPFPLTCLISVQRTSPELAITGPSRDIQSDNDYGLHQQEPTRPRFRTAASATLVTAGLACDSIGHPGNG